MGLQWAVYNGTHSNTRVCNGGPLKKYYTNRTHRLNVSATLMLFPSKLEEKRSLLRRSFSKLLMSTDHPSKVADWIETHFKSKKYTSLKKFLR